MQCLAGAGVSEHLPTCSVRRLGAWDLLEPGSCRRGSEHVSIQFRGFGELLGLKRASGRSVCRGTEPGRVPTEPRHLHRRRDGHRESFALYIAGMAGLLTVESRIQVRRFAHTFSGWWDVHGRVRRRHRDAASGRRTPSRGPPRSSGACANSDAREEEGGKAWESSRGLHRRARHCECEFRGQGPRRPLLQLLSRPIWPCICRPDSRRRNFSSGFTIRLRRGGPANVAICCLYPAGRQDRSTGSDYIRESGIS